MRTTEKGPASAPSRQSRLRSLLLDDHCQWANRYAYWLKSPLGVLGLGALAALLCGLFVAPQGYVVLAAIAAVLATGLAWPKVGIRGLECEIAFAAPRAREGKPTPVEVRITNRWPFPVWGLVIEDGFFDVAPGEDASAVALARIGGWSQSTFHWDFTPTLRGRYPKATPSLTTAFPFGLWKASKPVSVDGTIVAWPKTFWLPPYPLDASQRAWTGEASDAHAGSEGERIGVRDHRQGDPLRLVHWAKTARHDRLIVSEREGATHRTALVSLDTEPRAHAGSGADASLEWAIRITASIAESLLAQGVRLELRVGDEQRGFGTAQHDLGRLMDWLAEYAPGSSDRFEPIRGACARRSRPSNRLLVGTTRSGFAPDSGTISGTILLDAGAFSANAERGRQDAATGCWILVDDPGHVADQVLRGWRRSAKEACRGA